ATCAPYFLSESWDTRGVRTLMAVAVVASLLVGCSGGSKDAVPVTTTTIATTTTTVTPTTTVAPRMS
ncbi:uncharacterized protein METZ01_LOCUS483675, partial [marine metagenome]